MFHAFIIVMSITGPVQIDSANGPHETIEECEADVALGIRYAMNSQMKILKVGCAKQEEDGVWI
jgi:hypothetical protein